MKKVLIARYTDIFCQNKEYLADPSTGITLAFFNEESAKMYLKAKLKLEDEQVDWFLYESVHICDDCQTPIMGSTQIFILNDKTICESCYYSPD